MKKKLGIVGGLGPLASALFYEQITRLTCVTSDQEHLEIVLYSAPDIPDRSAFLCGQSGENPFPRLLTVCRRLETITDVIAIPCMTIHHFYDELSAVIPVPVIDMHRVCAENMKARGITALGIMATDGTVKSGRLQVMLRNYGIEPVLPDRLSQDMIMQIIYGIKAGEPPDTDRFDRVRKRLAQQGAEAILLGCTELSLFKDVQEKERPLSDALDLLARHSIQIAGGTLVD